MLGLLMGALALAPPQWSVNPNRSLLWEGTPYLPLGARIEGRPEAVQAARQAGIEDLVIELPVNGEGWNEAIQAAQGARYCVAVMGGPPVDDVVAIAPESYRVPGITKRRTVRLDLPGVKEALVVLASQRDAKVRWSQSVVVAEGSATIDTREDHALDHVLLCYPTVRNTRYPDFFSAFDAWRDRLLLTIEAQDFGPGLRGFIDVLGPSWALPKEDMRFVPRSVAFQTELALALSQTYGHVSTAAKAWGLGTNDLATFEDLARLVPLWTESRGVGQLWDPVTGKLYSADHQRSAAWRDIRGVVRTAAARRVSRLAATIEKATGAPVMASADSVPDPAEGLALSFAALTARVRARSVPEAVDAVAMPASKALRQARLCALWVGDLEWEPGSGPLDDLVTELESVGCRGFFVRTTAYGEVARLAKARKGDLSAAEWGVQAMFYPLEARRPAAPVRHPGGVWWLPAPLPGARHKFGQGIEGVTFGSGDTAVHALWRPEGPLNVRLKVRNPGRVEVTALDGSPVPRRNRRHDMDAQLGPVPVLFRGTPDVPVPMVAMQEVTAMLTVLLGQTDTRVDPTGGEVFAFGSAVRAFESSPGPSFTMLRAMLRRLAPKVAPYSWLPAARSPKHNFSEVVKAAGSASEAVLTLEPGLKPESGTYEAEYPVSLRSSGPHEVWIAARIPEGAAGSLSATIAGRSFDVLGPPVGPYGDGFGWYRLGEFVPDGPNHTLVLRSPGDFPSRLSLDVVMIHPGKFVPDGPEPPVDFIKTLPAPKRPGKDAPPSSG
jgi:hypothetical protein